MYSEEVEIEENGMFDRIEAIEGDLDNLWFRLADGREAVLPAGSWPHVVVKWNGWGDPVPETGWRLEPEDFIVPPQNSKHLKEAIRAEYDDLTADDWAKAHEFAASLDVNALSFKTVRGSERSSGDGMRTTRDVDACASVPGLKGVVWLGESSREELRLQIARIFYREQGWLSWKAYAQAQWHRVTEFEAQARATAQAKQQAIFDDFMANWEDRFAMPEAPQKEEQAAPAPLPKWREVTDRFEKRKIDHDRQKLICDVRFDSDTNEFIVGMWQSSPHWPQEAPLYSKRVPWTGDRIEDVRWVEDAWLSVVTWRPVKSKAKPVLKKKR